MKYRTVVFDLDGTLLDTSEGIKMGASYTAEIFKCPNLTSEQQKSFIGPPLLNSFMRECRLSKNEARKAVGIYRKQYIQRGLYEAKRYENIQGLLQNLKRHNCKTAVATLKRNDLAKKILSHFELSKYFNTIIGIDDQDSLTKSDIILMCLDEIGEEDLSKVLLIGDSEYDALGAERIGIDFLAVTYGFGFNDVEDANLFKNVSIARNILEIEKFLCI